MALNARNIVTSVILISLMSMNYAECKSDYLTWGLWKGMFTLSINRFDGENCTIHQLDNTAWHACGEKGYMMDCSRLNLPKVPHTYPALNGTDPRLTPPLCALNLSYNRMITLGNNSFTAAINMNSTDVKYLYIQHSSIQYIESNAFLNLSKLVYLNLAGNNLKWPDGFGVEVFGPLVNLVNINLFGNNITKFNGLGQEMHTLTRLNKLDIDLCENCTFGKGFENVTGLTSLSLSQGIVGAQSCFAPTIYNGTFQYVPYVQHLFLGSCNINNIEPGALSPLKDLITLDISNNDRLHFEGMNTALYGLRNSTTLKVLNANGIYYMYDYCVKLKVTHLENLKTLHVLEVLHFDLNSIVILEDDAVSSFPDTLTNVTLSGNGLAYGNYINRLHEIKGLVHIDISKQHTGYNPFIYRHMEDGKHVLLDYIDNLSVTTHMQDNCSCSSPFVYCLPDKLESLNWSGSFVIVRTASIRQPIHVIICGAKHFKKLDLSFNFISSWKFIFFGLENMTELDLSMNQCDDIFARAFASYAGLRKLNISHNLLGKAFDKIEQSQQPDIFNSLTKLEELDLSSNMMTHLHEDMFRNLSNIKRLYLSDNLLTNWRTSLENSIYLEMLSLKNNKLAVLDERTTAYLDALTAGHCSNGVVVDLSDNPFDCDCDHQNFLQWLRDTKVKVKLSDETECSIKGKRHPLRNRIDLKVLMNILENDVCKDRTWITSLASILSVVCTGFLSAVGGTLIYKNRWKLRYLYYTRHRRHVLEGYDRLFQYDVFISYARTFGSFIKRSAVPMLEDTHHLTTWAYDKDSVPGVSMADNITHAINNSKKVVLLLNRDFLKDSWCEHETNMAYFESITTKRDMMIIVIMEQIPGEQLPLYMHRLLMSVRSVEYPENGQDENTFWMNLAEEIRA